MKSNRRVIYWNLGVIVIDDSGITSGLKSYSLSITFLLLSITLRFNKKIASIFKLNIFMNDNHF